MMLDRIHREHGYMVRLLGILQSKLSLLKKEEAVNYSLIAEVVDYFIHHAERVHHPKEDILYHHYIKHYDHDGRVEDLEAEHVALTELSGAFSTTLTMILKDAVVPHSVFVEQLEAFLVRQRRHLEIEERLVFPRIVEAFTIDDWQHVETLWHENEDDPVFGDTIDQRYRQLAERVRQSDNESI